jgi:hypothetical protein
MQAHGGNNRAKSYPGKCEDNNQRQNPPGETSLPGDTETCSQLPRSPRQTPARRENAPADPPISQVAPHPHLLRPPLRDAFCLRRLFKVALPYMLPCHMTPTGAHVGFPVDGVAECFLTNCWECLAACSREEGGGLACLFVPLLYGNLIYKSPVPRQVSRPPCLFCP